MNKKRLNFINSDNYDKWDKFRKALWKIEPNNIIEIKSLPKGDGYACQIGVFYLEDIPEPETPKEEITCENCGFKLKNKQNFCPECGGEL